MFARCYRCRAGQFDEKTANDVKKNHLMIWFILGGKFYPFCTLGVEKYRRVWYDDISLKRGHIDGQDSSNK